MTTKTKTSPINTPAALANKIITTVVTSLAEALTLAKNSGDSLLSFCKTAGTVLPVTVDEPSVIEIVDQLAAKLAWNGTPREKVSKSEARALIRQHHFLPEAILAVRAATGSCGYHDAVKVARLIKDHGNVADAVTAMTTKKEAAKVDPKVKAASALKAWYIQVRDGKKATRVNILKSIQAFATENGLDIGLGS